MMPVKAKMPSSAMKPKEARKTKSPSITPIIPIGAVQIMMKSLRISLSCSIKRTIMIITMAGTGFNR